MSERLGDALLDLKTNDSGYRAGIRRAERDALGLGRTLDNVANRAAMLGRALVAGAGVLGGAAIMDAASNWSDLQSQVNNAVGSMRAGEDAMGRIVNMARRSYSSITQTTNAFLANSTALTELNYNTGQQLDLAETLNNALVISATRGQRAEAVMRAWSNALALGEMNGQNLNTIIQGSARLTKALADSMGVSTNELRRLGAEGKITTREMMGVTSQLGQLREEADAMPATPADALVLLGNAAMLAVGAIDQATGASSWLAGELIQLADDIERAAKNWREGEVPLLKFIQAVAEAGRELGLLTEAIEDNRTEMQALDSAVDESRQAVADFAAELTGLQNMQDFAPNLPGAIQRAIDKLTDGTATAEETRRALIDLGTANPDFSVAIGRLAGLVASLREAEGAANDMQEALLYASSGGPTGDGGGRGALGQSRRARKEREAATAAYVTEQNRLVGLSREQLTLEQAIAREKERATAAGIRLSDAEAERLAKARLAQAERGKGSGRDEAAEKAKREAEEVQRLIDHLQMELDILRETDPVQRRLIELRDTLANATGKQREEIERLIEETERERAALDAGQDAADFFGRSIYDALSSLKSGGRDAADVAHDLADALASAALQAALLGQGPLAGMFGLQEGGGLLGSLFSGFFARGGLIPNGTFGIVGEKGPEPVIGTSRGAMVLPNSVLSSGGGGRGDGDGVQVIINKAPPDTSVREERGSAGGRELRKLVIDIVKEEEADGGFDGTRRGRYGFGPVPVRRGR